MRATSYRLIAGLVVLLLAVAACGDADSPNAPTEDDSPQEQETEDTSGDSASSDESYTFTVSSIVGPTHPGQKHFEWWADRVKEYTDGRVDFEIVYGGGLLGTTDTIPGVGDGRADMGYAPPQYHPAELPLATLAELPFITRNAEAQMRAANELYENNEAFRQEWNDLGVEVLFFVLAGQTLLASKEPIPGIDALAGKQIRAAGRVAEAIEAAGANAIAIDFVEIYESLERGLLDAATSVPLGAIFSAELYTPAPYIYDPGFGESIVFQSIIMNKETLDGLPDDIRAAMDRATEEYWEAVPEMMLEDEAAACEAMIEAGATFETWPEAERERWPELIGGQQAEEWVEAREAEGLPGEEIFEEYTSLIEQFEEQATYVPAIEACEAASG